MGTDYVFDRRRDVEKMLLRRGLRVLGANPRDGLILPEGADPEIERRFYELAKKYSFRLMPKRMVRELFKVGENVYIANSKPGLVLNVMLCLKDWLGGKGLTADGGRGQG